MSLLIELKLIDLPKMLATKSDMKAKLKCFLLFYFFIFLNEFLIT